MIFGPRPAQEHGVIHFRAISSVIALVAFAVFDPLLRGASDVAADRAAQDFFEQQVRPLLVDKCLSCHSTASGKQKGGLLLDSREAILRGGESGPAAKEGDAESSLLYRAVTYHEPDLQMPPKEKLLPKDVETLRAWITSGLPFPEASARAASKKTIDLAAARQFWSLKPLQPPPSVTSKVAGFARSEIDRLIEVELTRAGLSRAPEASRAALLRRVVFDLTGLPPTPEEVTAFESDSSSDAYERRVATLLESAAYGERWARHWLDLVRYCDIGESWMEGKGKAYPYRDWVISALNEDMAFDRFVALQLAADQIPDSRPSDRAALGMLGISPSYWKELQLPVEIIKSIVSDEYEERVHTLSSVFLGFNMACARCHDHKSDPFTQEDYYGLAGVFASTRTAEHALSREIDAARVVDLRGRVAKLEEEAKKLKAKKNEDHAARLEAIEKEVAELKADPQFNALLVNGVRDGSLFVEPEVKKHGSRLVYKDEPKDLAVEVRGNPNRTGVQVPRRLPLVFTPKEPLRFSSGSGRLELAKALTEVTRDLVARVIVNRIWLQHFGKGIVNTPSDFGVQGEPPSNPALLDVLASRFIENGWSLKWLHREIVLSATYRQASGTPPEKDADFRLLSRFPRRRLDIEQWRDAMLCVAGNLDRTQGGEPVDLSASTNRRRTVYGTVKRRELNDLLRLHDFPDPVTHSPVRVPTTTPLQQLFTLNSPLMQQQAAALAKRLEVEGDSTEARVIRAHQLLFARRPTPLELDEALRFIVSENPASFQDYLQVLLGSNEFHFLD